MIFLKLTIIVLYFKDMIKISKLAANVCQTQTDMGWLKIMDNDNFYPGKNL